MINEEELIQALEGNDDEYLVPLMEEWLMASKQTCDDISDGNSTDGEIQAARFEYYVTREYPKLAKFIAEKDPMLYYCTLQMFISA